VARRMRRSVRRSKDLVWITTIVEASFLDPTPSDAAVIVTPADWNGASLGFDRCTLMAVRGWLGYAQQAASTAAEATALWLAMYVTDTQVAANSMDPSGASEYNVFDTLWTDGLALTLSTGTGAPIISRQLEIKSRRKLTTASDVRLAGCIPTDTGSPRVNVCGCVRALLRLDPPG